MFGAIKPVAPSILIFFFQPRSYSGARARCSSCLLRSAPSRTTWPYQPQCAIWKAELRAKAGRCPSAGSLIGDSLRWPLDATVSPTCSIFIHQYPS